MKTKYYKMIYLIFLSLLFTGCSKNSSKDETTKLQSEMGTFNSLEEQLVYTSKMNIDSIKTYLSMFEKIEKPRFLNTFIYESLPQIFLPKEIKKNPEFASKMLGILSSKRHPRLYKMTLGLQAYAKAEEVLLTPNAASNIKDYLGNPSKFIPGKENSINTILKIESSLPASKEALSERYRLMIYNLLIKHSPGGDYENILDKAIKNSKEILSGLAPDNTSSYQEFRASFRYYLAYAYHEKANYQLKRNDRKNALKYYKLSSVYSPDTTDRKIMAYYKLNQFFLHGYDG